MSEIRAGLVSVILVNFRGADDTIEAIRQLGLIDWPSTRIEIIVVENNSGDDSAARIAAAAPHAKLVISKTNLGFAGGCNLGVKASSGEYIALLNNDAKPDAHWISAAVDSFESSVRIGAVASQVLDWDGKLVDFIGAGLTWFGMGYKPYTGTKVPRDLTESRDVLFGTGSAMFIRRSVFDELGGFDERYFMFFEDVDLGWRLNLRGWRFYYNPASIAFHKHHASMASIGAFRETYLLERNALFSMYKNFEQATLDRALPAALALSVRRAVAKGKLDSTSMDITRRESPETDTVEILKESVSSLFAIDQFVEQLPELAADRAAVQSSRVISDSGLWRLFGDPDAPSSDNKNYLDGYMKIASTFDVLDPPQRTKVLVITGDPIGVKLAGPAIRAWAIAEALSERNDVTLMSLSRVEDVPAPFALVHVAAARDREFAPWEKWADVIVFQGHALEVFGPLQKSNKILVADIYDPMHLEQLEQTRELARGISEARVSHATRVLNQQLSRADFFLCASERQRIFFLGQLAALGRINPANYAGDPDLSGLISVVPFGLNRIAPSHKRPVLKGVYKGIKKTDKLLLWSGGLYNWFDPQTLITAVASLSKKHSNVRLFFQGTKHPHPDIPEMEIVSESRELAKSLGVLDKAVFFNDSWVDYADRENYLTEADAGVSTHNSHIETTMSFRTRILDYLWAELPMVVTEGDTFAELVQEKGLGLVVRANDPHDLANALERILFDAPFIAKVRENLTAARQEFFWDRVLEPLVTFVDNAHRSNDASNRHASDWLTRGSGARTKPRVRVGLKHNISRSIFYLRNGGPVVLARKVANRARRLI